MTHSGIAKSAKVIAVKVLGDDGCVLYVPSRVIRLTRTSKGLVTGLMCGLLPREASLCSDWYSPSRQHFRNGLGRWCC